MIDSRQNSRQPTFFTNHPGRIWLLGGIITLLLVAAALLFLAPRLLTSSTVKQKIQTIVAEKTSGDLDYQAIDLCYFPQPGIELQGVSLTFPEQLQGTIAALRISPKLLPLLQGEVQLASLRLDAPQLQLTLPAAKTEPTPTEPLTLTALQDKINNAMGAVRPMPAGLKAVVNDGQLSVKQGKNDLLSMAGVNLQGDISGTDGATGQVKLTTSIADLVISHHEQQTNTEVKLELSEVSGEVVIDKTILQGSKLSARLKNSTARDGTLRLGLTKAGDVFLLELALQAELAEIYPWLASLEGLQEPLHKISEVSGQIDLANLKLQGALDQPAAWKITSAGTLHKVTLKTKRFPDTISLASGQFTMDAGQLNFKKVQAASQDAALTASGSVKGFPQQFQRLDLNLTGSIGKQSFTWLATQLGLPNSYRVHTPLTINAGKVSWQPEATASFDGQVTIDKGPSINADVNYSKDRLQIHQLTIKDQYSDATIVVDLVGKQRHGKFTGRLQHETLQALFVDSPFGGGELDGDMAVSVPSTQQAAVTVKGRLSGKKLPVTLPSGDEVYIDQLTLQGDGTDIKVGINTLTWEKLTWTPVKGIVSFTPDSTEIKIIEAGLCGIDSPGTITTTGDTVSIALSLTGQGLRVADSYTCLTNGEVKMTGKLDFTSRITATGQADRLIKHLQGPLHMTFSNGVITQDKMLSRILEVLNVTEIIKGRLPNLANKGFAYTSMTVEGRFHDGQLSIDKYHMDGETLDIIGKGEINLLERSIDMQLFASPLQTVDNIVKHIPGVNYILDGSLVSIPVGISGQLTDPKVQVLSPSAVSSSLVNMAKRTLKSPFKLLDALNPWSKN